MNALNQVAESDANLRDALADVLAAWNAAAQRWDAAALGKTYAQAGCLFGGRPGHSIGRAAITEYFASYDGVILSGAIRAQDQHVVDLAPGIVLAQGYVEMSFVLAPDQKTQSVLRSTLTLVQEAGEWKILQHHFSPTPVAPPLGNR